MTADHFRFGVAFLAIWCLGISAPAVASGTATWGHSIAVSLTALLILTTVMATVYPILIGMEAGYTRLRAYLNR